MAPAPVASMSPCPLVVTLRPLRGQMRTWPPRNSLSVAGAIPADNSDPESTLIPEPAGCTELALPASDANSSPTGAGVWPHAGAQSKRNAAQACQAVLFTIADT